jgi:hypothetical protein
MYHILYKTTNIVNGKYYIGVHSTNNLDDGYLGSGIYLLNSISKYGKKNFKREILESFESREELFEREKHIVNEDLRKDRLCMNLKNGGEGLDLEASSLGGKALWKRYYSDEQLKNQMSKCFSETIKRNHRLGKMNTNNNHRRLGHKNSKEMNSKIGKANSIKQKGEGNSQFGTCWIYNLELEKNKSIKKSELQNFLDQGWIKGRKYFNN